MVSRKPMRPGQTAYCDILSTMSQPLLLELYALDEMARTRGDATWTVLDWCAKQPGDFTINDMYHVYSAAGGQSSPTSFATIINYFVAKYDPNAVKDKHRNKAKYGLSEKRPLIISRRGHQGKGGAARYEWGLDGPLREPPPDVDPSASGGGGGDADDDPISVAMDALEQKMGGPALKSAMNRWKRMRDMRQVTADIRSLPPKLQMNALLVASQHLMSIGKADEADVDDAEQELELDPAVSVADAEPVRTPFSPGKPKVKTAAAATDTAPATFASEPEDELAGVDDDLADEWADDSNDKTDPDAVSPFVSTDSESEVETDPETTGSENDDGESDPDVTDDATTSDASESDDEAHEFDMSDYPDWLPPAKNTGTKGERALYRLVDSSKNGGANIGPSDRMWAALENADDEESALEILTKIFRNTKYDKKFLPDAIAVSKEVLSGSDEDEDAPDDDIADDNDDSSSANEIPDDAKTTGEAGDDEYPEWLPQPEEDGSNAEMAMFRLLDELHEAGIDEYSEFYKELRSAKNAVDAHRIIMTSASVPRNLTKSALVVAKAIFQHDGRDWDSGNAIGGSSSGPKKESRGLGRLFRLYESTAEKKNALKSGLAGLIRLTRKD